MTFKDCLLYTCCGFILYVVTSFDAGNYFEVKPAVKPIKEFPVVYKGKLVTVVEKGKLVDGEIIVDRKNKGYQK